MYGVRVTVTFWSYIGLNVNVHIPSSAFSEEEKPSGLGLCGNFNGDKYDEFYLPDINEEKDESIFENYWKVNKTEDFFTCSSPVEEEREFCQCEGIEDQEKNVESTGIICGLSSPLLRNKMSDSKVKLLIPGFLKNNDGQGYRKRRSTDNNYIDEYDFDYQPPDSSFYEPAVGDDSPPDWGTFGISEAEAENTCRGVLSNNVAVTVCQEYVTDSLMDIIVDKCKDDIRRTGNESFASPYISEYQAYCIHNFLNEADVTDPDNPMDDPVFSQIYNSMMSMMCTNNCSDHGICELGSCVCENGYIGADCSLPVGTQPTVTQYKGPLECDIRDRPCRMVQVQAENLTSSNNLSCQIHVQMANGSEETYTYGGELYTSDVIFCPLPDPTTILTRSNSHLYTVSVSLSNDGEIFSDTPTAQQISVFDSDQVWAACSGNGIYEPKSGTCFIEGQCYRSGEKKGSCQVCDPTIDGQDWTVQVGCVTGSDDLSTTSDGSDVALESTKTRSHESTADVNFTPASSTDSLPALSSETTTSSTNSLSASNSMTPASSTDSLPASSSMTTTPAAQQTTKLTSSTKQGIPTRVTTIPDSELCYGSWTELSICSKSCDYGIKSRTRDCLCDACTRTLHENELCNEINCEELETNGAGLRISFQGVTMIGYVAKEKEILTVALDLLNEYSKTHVADLCHSVGLDVLGQPIIPNMIFADDNIRVATGYPKYDAPNDVVKSKLIVGVTHGELSSICLLSSGKRRRRDVHSDHIFLDNHYMELALADLDIELTEVMGDGVIITIDQNSEEPQPEESQKDTMRLVVIIIPVVLVVLVVTIVAPLVVIKKKKTRSPRPYPEKIYQETDVAPNGAPPAQARYDISNPITPMVRSSNLLSRANMKSEQDNQYATDGYEKPAQVDAPDVEMVDENMRLEGPSRLERQLTQSEISIKEAW